MSESAVAEAPVTEAPAEETPKKRRGRKHQAAEAAEAVPAPESKSGHITVLKVRGRKFQVPFADLLPRISDEEFKERKADIKERGILDPVTLLEIKGEPDLVVDGHTRLVIAAELGIPYKDIPFHYLKGVTREEVEEDAVRMNFQKRRNTAEVRAHMAHLLSHAPHNYSTRRVGRMLGCDHTTILDYLREPDPMAPVEEGEAPAEEEPSEKVRGSDNRTYKRKKKSRAGGHKPSSEERQTASRVHKARKAGMKACKVLAKVLGALDIQHQQTEKAKYGAIVQEVYDLIEAVKP